MTRFSAGRPGATVLVGLLALALTACTNELRPDETAKWVTNAVSRQTGFHPSDVTCPSGLEAKVGGEFDCHFTGPEGPYTARVKITKVDGETVNFDLLKSSRN